MSDEEKALEMPVKKNDKDKKPKKMSRSLWAGSSVSSF